MSDTISLVLFSGTDDKLDSAATVIAGAAALGMSVNVLLQFHALDAFRRDRMAETPTWRWDAGEPVLATPALAGRPIRWPETIRQAKELGDVTIRACSGSLDVLGLTVAELDPIVEDAAGIASFLLAADGGQVMFI